MGAPVQPSNMPVIDTAQTVDATHDFAAPDSAHQTNGWQKGEIPASGNFNWLFNAVTLWTAYIKAIFAYVLGFNANEVLAFTGSVVVPTQANSTFASGGGTVNTATPTNFNTGMVWTAIGNGLAGVTLVNMAGGAGQLNLVGGANVQLNTVQDAVTFQYDGANWNEIGRSASLQAVPPDTFHARLTASSTLPVTTADQTAVTTLYLLPYKGKRISTYSPATGTWLAMDLPSAGVSIIVPATTSQTYDMFVVNNAGTPTFEKVAWTNDTTRATPLALQDGIYVQSVYPQFRYVGTFRTTSVSGQTEDSLVKRYVWNYYNRVERPLFRQDPATSWAGPTPGTWRQANANTANQLEYVIGIVEDMVDLNVSATLYTDANASHYADGQVGISFNAIAAPGAGVVSCRSTVIDAGLINGYVPVVSAYKGYPAVGRTYAAWVEIINAIGGTANFIGTNGTYGESSMRGQIQG